MSDNEYNNDNDNDNNNNNNAVNDDDGYNQGNGHERNDSNDRTREDDVQIPPADEEEVPQQQQQQQQQYHQNQDEEQDQEREREEQEQEQERQRQRQVEEEEEKQRQKKQKEQELKEQQQKEQQQKEQQQKQQKEQQQKKQQQQQPVEEPADDDKEEDEEEHNNNTLSVSSHGHIKTNSIMSKPLPTNLNLDSAWKEICVDSPAINWYLFTVDKKMDLNFKGAGQRGFKEMTDILRKSETELLFGLLRVNSHDKGGSRRAKFVYVRFVGSKVGFMQKAKITPKLGKIGDSFPVKHMTYDLTEDLGNFTIETISKEMLRVGGAHKPDSFDYGPDQVFICK